MQEDKEKRPRVSRRSTTATHAESRRPRADRVEEERDSAYDEREESRALTEAQHERRAPVSRESRRADPPAKASKAAPPSQKQSTAHGGDSDRLVHQITPYVMFWVALFAGVSFVLRDLLQLDGITGAFGSWLAEFLCGLLGVTAYALPLFLIVLALRWKKLVKDGALVRKLVLSISFLLLLSGIIHVFQEDPATRGYCHTEMTSLYAQGAARTGGGFFGGFIGEWLGSTLRLPGTILLAIPLLLIVGIYLIGMTPGGIYQRISRKLSMISERREERRRALFAGEEPRRVRASKKTEALVAENDDAEAADYEFSGEEHDGEQPVISRRAARRGAKAAGAKPIADRTVELIDIPDDEIEPEVPEDPIPTPHRVVADRGVESLLAEMEAAANAPEPPAAPAPAVQAPEQEPVTTPVAPPTPAPTPYTMPAPDHELQGEYYSPFALPVRPEPKRSPEGESATSATAAEKDNETELQRLAKRGLTVGSFGTGFVKERETPPPATTSTTSTVSPTVPDLNEPIEEELGMGTPPPAHTSSGFAL